MTHTIPEIKTFQTSKINFKLYDRRTYECENSVENLYDIKILPKKYKPLQFP